MSQTINKVAQTTENFKINFNKIKKICNLLNVEFYDDPGSSQLSIYSEKFVIDISEMLELIFVDENLNKNSKYVVKYFEEAIKREDYILFYYFFKHFLKFFNENKDINISEENQEEELIFLNGLFFDKRITSETFLCGNTFKEFENKNIFTNKKILDKIERRERRGNFEIKDGNFYENGIKNLEKSYLVKKNLDFDDILTFFDVF